MKTLLDLLVTSETRKQLLKKLWQEGVEASANQLAHLCGCSYASVYDELEQMVRDGLVLKVKQGKSNLYSSNLKSEFAEPLKQLLGRVKSPSCLSQLKASEVESHLFVYGAPLGGVKSTECWLSLEEALVAGVALARKNSTVARVLPVVVAKNVKAIDSAKLLFLTRQESLNQEMGFLLDLTGTLSGSRKFKDLARQLKDHRVKKSQPFFTESPKGKYARLLEDQNTPYVAKKWHFSMNMGLDSFSSLFEKSMAEGE